MWDATPRRPPTTVRPDRGPHRAGSRRPRRPASDMTTQAWVNAALLSPGGPIQQSGMKAPRQSSGGYLLLSLVIAIAITACVLLVTGEVANLEKQSAERSSVSRPQPSPIPQPTPPPPISRP